MFSEQLAPETYWRIDFLHDEGESFLQYDFEHDHLIIYVGMFGIPGYILWHCALDKALIPFIGGKIRVSIVAKSGRKLDIVKPMTYERQEIFAETYTIKTAIFDPRTSRFKIFAISSTFELLQEAGATQFKNLGPEGIDGYELLYQLTQPLGMEYYQIKRKSYNPSIRYTKASFDPTFSLLDIISKVCIENGWEFYIHDFQLHIGNPWWINQNIHKTRRHLILNKLYTRLGMEFRTFYGEITAANPGVLTGGSRIMWLIFNFGSKTKNNDTIMHGVASNNLSQSITEREFVETLGDLPRQMGLQRLNKSYAQEALLLGKVFGDFEEDETVKDQYRAPKFRGDIVDFQKDLDKRQYAAGEEEFEEWPKFIYNEDIKLTTPYAGDGVGILFPQSESHKLLFSPGGDREVSIVGPAYFGINDEVPFREEAEDFRLQLPGATVYIKRNGEVLIEQSVNAEDVPDGSGNSIRIAANGSIFIKSSGSVNIDGSQTLLQGGGSKLSHADHQHMVGNMGAPIPPHSPAQGTFTTEAD